MRGRAAETVCGVALWVLLAGAGAVAAPEAVFYRVSASAAATLGTVACDGANAVLQWTSPSTQGTYVVQWAAALSPSAASPWYAAAWGRVTGAVNRVTLPAFVPYVSRVVVGPGRFTTGIEGPAVATNGDLYAVNYGQNGTVGRMAPGGACGLFAVLPANSLGNGIRLDRRGNLFVADKQSHRVLRIDRATSAISVHAAEPTMHEPNDLAIAADGTLYASDPDWSSPRNDGRIWRIATNGVVTRVVGGMESVNGIELSPDETRLYANEYFAKKLWAFDRLPGGGLTNKVLIATFPGGVDGMRCDRAGNLYVACFDRGSVIKVTAAGTILREIPLIGTKPTNIAFGGPDGRTGYVTVSGDGSVEAFRVETPGREWPALP